MHIEEYITSVGKQHRNERQNYEFWSISSLRKFIEDAVNQNLVKSDVISSFCSCDKPQTVAGTVTKPNQMSSGASKINEALEKIEAQFAKEEKDQISYHLVIVGEYGNLR